MSIDVVWGYDAGETLMRMPDWKDADRIGAAVRAFAATGAGTIEQMTALDGERFSALIVTPYAITFGLVRNTLRVRRISRHAP